jgi:HD superfamily phosphohydrolase
MQRLKYLHQLGPNYFVFPGATHNRFEHSIGTAHLCALMMDRLQEKKRNQVMLSQCDYPVALCTPEEHKCVVLAGLMHDMGHGIYSHMFDRVVIKSIYEQMSAKERAHSKLEGWEHEHASGMLI